MAALTVSFPAPELSPLFAQEPSKQSGEAPPPSAWGAKCASSGRKEPLDCSVEQTLSVTKTQQQLLSVMVRIPPDSRQPALMIQLPFGLSLQAGVTLQFDAQKPERLDIQTCDLKGCYAGSAVSAKMLEELKRSERLTITFQDLAKNNINVPVALKGFAAAYQKIQ